MGSRLTLAQVKAAGRPAFDDHLAVYFPGVGVFEFTGDAIGYPVGGGELVDDTYAERNEGEMREMADRYPDRWFWPPWHHLPGCDCPYCREA